MGFLIMGAIGYIIKLSKTISPFLFPPWPPFDKIPTHRVDI